MGGLLEGVGPRLDERDRRSLAPPSKSSSRGQPRCTPRHPRTRTDLGAGDAAIWRAAGCGELRMRAGCECVEKFYLREVEDR